MDGKEALFRLRNLLNEDSGSSFLDTRLSYTYLYEAAIEFVELTNTVRGEQTITTVADQASYTLDAEFLKLEFKTEDNKHFIKYYDGSNYSFLTEKDYEDIYYANETTSVLIPENFAISSASLSDRVTGTATSAGSASGGECTLTDTAADFSNVEAGDIVHNTTDGSDGIVLSKTSTTALVTALFDGTNNDWSSSDAYVIQPQGRLKIIIDPPPSTASHTITVPYIKKPAPVYSSYGTYPVQPQYIDAFCKYAAFLYKYRDREPNYGDAWWRTWNLKVRTARYQIDKKFLRRKIGVNMKKRR